MREHRAARKLLMAAGIALLTVGIYADTSAQTGRTGRATARTSREASLLSINKGACAAGFIDPARELFITDVSVVDDCIRTTWGPCIGPIPVPPATQGAWTFGGLVPGIFGTTNTTLLHSMVMSWLNEWAVFQNINGDPINPRPNIQSLVITPWLTASGGAQLDMKKAPFRLLAIVSRLDLRQPSSAPDGITAGEGRFVFNLLDGAGNPTEFLLILEYGLDAKLCTDVQDWAQSWHTLGTIPFGPSYNAALQKLTDRFTSLGASPGKPNGSALNQARTNDFLLASPWELREFTLKPGSSRVAPLQMSTVAQTPANSHQFSPLVASYVNANTLAILANLYTVPLTWSSASFRGGASTHVLDFNWDGPPPRCSSITNANARHVFSLNTCNGCHGGETRTRFKHVEPRLAGASSALSNFLIGGPAFPDICGIGHTFNDIQRREVDLCNLLVSTCSTLESEPVIKFVH